MVSHATLTQPLFAPSWPLLALSRPLQAVLSYTCALIPLREHVGILQKLSQHIQAKWRPLKALSQPLKALSGPQKFSFGLSMHSHGLFTHFDGFNIHYMKLIFLHILCNLNLHKLIWSISKIYYETWFLQAEFFFLIYTFLLCQQQCTFQVISAAYFLYYICFLLGLIF